MPGTILTPAFPGSMRGTLALHALCVLWLVCLPLPSSGAGGVQVKPAPTWVRQMGGQGSDYYWYSELAADGSVFSLGVSTSDSFGAGFTGSYQDLALAHYAADGTLINSARLGYSGFEDVSSVSVWRDKLIVTGTTTSSWPGATHSGMEDGLVLVLDAATLAVEDTLLLGSANEDAILEAMVIGDALIVGGYTDGNVANTPDGFDILVASYDLTISSWSSNWVAQYASSFGDPDAVFSLAPGMPGNDDFYATGLFANEFALFRFSQVNGDLLQNIAILSGPSRSQTIGLPVLDVERGLVYTYLSQSWPDALNTTLDAWDILPGGALDTTPAWSTLAFERVDPDVFSVFDPDESNGSVNGATLIPDSDLLVMVGYVYTIDLAEALIFLVDVDKHRPAEAGFTDIPEHWRAWGAADTVLDALYTVVATQETLFVAGETHGTFPGQPSNQGAWPTPDSMIAEQGAEGDAVIAAWPLSRPVTPAEPFNLLVILAITLTVLLLVGAVVFAGVTAMTGEQAREQRRKRPMSFAPTELMSLPSAGTGAASLYATTPSASSTSKTSRTSSSRRPRGDSLKTNDDGRGEGGSRHNPRVLTTIPMSTLIETTSAMVSVNSEMAPDMSNRQQDPLAP